MALGIALIAGSVMALLCLFDQGPEPVEPDPEEVDR